MGNKQVKLGCVSAPNDDGEHPRDVAKCNMQPKTKQNENHNHHHHRREYSTSTISTLSTISETETFTSSDTTSTSSTSARSPSPPTYLSSEDDEHEQDIYYPYYKMNVKILFLDVDGVLNNQFTKWDSTENGLNDKLLKYLKLILLKTGCRIVLSTTWRLNENAKQILLHTFKTKLDINIDDIVIGQTRDLKHENKHRSFEIYDYLKRNEYRFNVISWCALDDLSLDKFDKFSKKLMDGHFVKTNPKLGIVPENALKVIDILNYYDYQQNPYLYQRACYYS